ncbi:hypothetical protein L202_05915 [Cryptococcus amylolentus CBS 6039]|uniref:Zn(2)-C6 fungal-type domain-containing protein n=1 Tax=Cryptococcus amylolentus CBS 6039 TaxID=1295533 RepID=A0A1E3HHV5_9TREE|nr:hypothetical protein L202_05915 [Cryptococcus amylolentus CBS 6039]ODN75930.1 hypothetical protein L202_05915 [Cryptococcus amylolentus CBS 6039]
MPRRTRSKPQTRRGSAVQVRHARRPAYAVESDRKSECRRLKLKCDREVPCSNCVRRGCRELCPDGTKETRRGGLDAKSAEALQKRLTTLEGLLSEHGLEVGEDSSIQRRPSRRDSDATSVHRSSILGEDWKPNRGTSESPYYSTSNRRSRSPSRGRGEMQASRYPISNSPGTNPFSYPSPNGGPSSSQPSSIVAPHPQLPPISSFNTRGSAPVGSPVEHSHGTLVIGKSGRSRYLGPTAGTEWLKNQEMGGMETPGHSRSPVAGTSALANPQIPSKSYSDPLYSFPFNEPVAAADVETLFSRLPARGDAEVLVDSYYRYFAWNHDPAPRKTFQPIFEKVYDASQRPQPEASVHLQQLALVYIILAMGTVHNIELPPHDESAEEYLALAKGSLTKGNFLNHGTIAGVQTLVTMAHYYLETESGRNGDAAWPLWGLAMSLVVAMGLHRDGAKWDLPEDVVHERRHVFWECHTIEVFQANCFSRPNSLANKFIDTAFPSPNPSEIAMGGKGWPTLKFELCQISSRILEVGLTVNFQAYDTIQKLYAELCDFELNVPYDMRCRCALLALPSVYPDANMARRNSPEVSRHNLHRTLQTYTLALNIAEAILFLQRPYFVMAMHDEPNDPTRSLYGHSYLAVVERCNVIIQVVSDLYRLHPTIISRQWFFWYHLFTAAVCLGTLILKNPQSALAAFALSQIEQAIHVYSTLIKQNNSPSMVQNHDWLVRLHQRSAKKIAQTCATAGNGTGPHTWKDDEQGQEEEDRELLGWKTRLIERAASGAHKAINIPSKPIDQRTPSPMVNNAAMTPAMHLLQQHFVPPLDPPPVSGMLGTSAHTLGMDNSTDLLLHQFWDPMMMPDGGNMTSANWWSWDLGMPENGAPPPSNPPSASQHTPQSVQNTTSKTPATSGTVPEYRPPPSMM